jgi:hypothetical protein
MITRVSSVIRPKGSDLIFDHPYNADYEYLLDWWASARSWMQISCYVLGGGLDAARPRSAYSGRAELSPIDLAGLKDAHRPGPIVTAVWAVA